MYNVLAMNTWNSKNVDLVCSEILKAKALSNKKKTKKIEFWQKQLISTYNMEAYLRFVWNEPLFKFTIDHW